MNKKIKVGVIGVGALGRHHTRLYKNVENAELIGVFDVSNENAVKIAEEFDTQVFDTIEALSEKCDALSIAVPATKHYEVATSLLKSGKHLLMEKPLATTIEDATKLVALAKENNVVLGVGHVERFNPAMSFLESRKALTRFIEVHRLAVYPPARPGQHRRGVEVGVVLDLMIHDIDLILSMIDSEVEKIDAVGIPVLSETEDIANVRLKFKNGAVVNLTASRVSQDPTRRFRVFQNDAYISLDYGSHKGLVVKKGKLALAKKEVDLDEYNALEMELTDFIDTVKDRFDNNSQKETKVSGQQGLDALKLAIQIVDEINKYNEQYHFDEIVE